MFTSHHYEQIWSKFTRLILIGKILKTKTNLGFMQL